MASPVRRLVTYLPPPIVYRVSQLRRRSALFRRITSGFRDAVAVGDHTIMHGVAKGLRINATAAPAQYVLGTVDLGVQVAMQRLCRQGWICYDVGANVGFCSLLLGRLVSPSGTVLAFEPDPANYAWLQHNITLNPSLSITAKRLALGKRDGYGDMVHVRSSTQRKVLYAEHVDNAADPQSLIPVRRADALINSEAIPPPDLIKIDVEGAELEVIEGMDALLRTKRPVLICEMHGNLLEMKRLLSEYGYSYVLHTGEPSLDTAFWNVIVMAVPDEQDILLRDLRDCFSIQAKSLQ
jgi:FkbM family methyltransferase